MNILVIGAAGFIGSHICERFIKAGHQVWGIDNLSRGLESNLEAIRNHLNFTFILGDAGNIKLIEHIEIQTIVHLASQKIPRYSSGWETLQEKRAYRMPCLNFL
jgi:dTDP-glucose 4,6-dehydratase